MAPGDTSRLYHRLTSYTPEREWDAPIDDARVLQDFEANVRETFPAHCKAYRGLLLTCVGVPAYRHRPGGPPGAPTNMRPVSPRSS